MFANGFVITQPPPASAVLMLSIYLDNMTAHSLTAATAAQKSWAEAHGYTLWIANVGYVCTTASCGQAPPPPPVGPTVLLRQPGAILEECTTESAAAAAGWAGILSIGNDTNATPTTIIAHVTSGNLIASVLSNGTVTFTRLSDATRLLWADATFTPGVTDDAAYWQMGLGFTTHATDRVHGLGQLEGTTSNGGCPIDGKQVRALLLPLIYLKSEPPPPPHLQVSLWHWNYWG